MIVLYMRHMYIESIRGPLMMSFINVFKYYVVLPEFLSLPRPYVAFSHLPHSHRLLTHPTYTNLHEKVCEPFTIASNAALLILKHILS